MIRPRFLWSAVLFLTASAATAVLPSSTPDGARPDPPSSIDGKVLVELHAELRGKAGAEKAANRIGGRLDRLVGGGRYAVLDTGGIPASMAVRRLEGAPDVAAAAPVYRRRLAVTYPNDPQFPTHQWALNNTGQIPPWPAGAPAGTADADIDAPEAWDITTGSLSVVVAVIDTGIATSNSNLAPNLWVNTDEIPGDGLDNDGNGYIDDRNGYNFAARSAVPEDDHGHGSFCAGIVGARGNNGISLTGVNWQVSLMALKAFSASGSGSDADLVEAIEYAADNGARVINASWGDYAYSAVLESVIRSVGERGVLFVAAAGNDGSNLREVTFYPAGFTLPNLLCVGSTNSRDLWSVFSNFDDTLLDIYAPGENVYSTGRFADVFGNGTSYAAPHVAGAAALLLASEPALSPDALRRRLRAAAERRASLAGRVSSSGRLSAYQALSAAPADPLPPAPVTDLAADEVASNGFRLIWTAPGDDGLLGTAALYDIRIAQAAMSEADFSSEQRVPHVPLPSSSGSGESLYVTGLEPATTYHLRLVASDEGGTTSPLSNQLTVTTTNRTVYFADDMENGDGKWSVSGSFALTTASAHRGSWSWTDSPAGNYGADSLAILTSVPFDLSSATDAWLRFHHQHIFDDSGSTLYDHGEVQVTTDTVNFITLARYVDFATPWRQVLINLKEYAGSSSVQLRFRFRSDSLKHADGWYVDDVEVYQPGAQIPEPADSVLESKTPFATSVWPGYAESGNWLDSASKAVDSHLRATRSRYAVTDNATTPSTALFTPLFDADGVYEVFTIWGISANATNVRHRVAHQEGQSDTYLTQNGSTNSNSWHSLGTYHFARGRSTAAGSVLIDTSSVDGKPLSESEGRVYSDAIRFVYRGPASARVGEWMLHADRRLPARE